ncbi:OmpH family outer membrane protein [Sinomicrobium weinanense]|uniref:OmpH family outer membrane protein n=1 Tax=Sinomicrobium weinanense TaxID=2842200 RepID=A0A926JSP2_9FLAO|nr:OmpH family outer membrane protein [Sinomicrobium weinanense]MBC9796666.1 OmpH family outer membrane protein [Sinomicrobium weinanense]MBU3124916.1 OmpH family outer membrane protein [Sinomicrobium weinanense]
MKQLKTLAIAVVLALGAVSFANAQSKVAHVNVQQLMEDMPEMKAAKAELKKLEDQYSADLKSSGQELQNRIKLYESEASTKSEEENKKRAEEVQGMQTNIMQARQTAEQELQKKQMELIQPILEKAQKAIQKVGKTQGFQYILDASPGSGVLLADGKDILPDVKKELGF